MAKGLKYNLGVRALKKLVTQQEQTRRFPPFAEVKEVMLAWDEAQMETDAKEIQRFVKFLENHGKSVVKVVYFHKKKKTSLCHQITAPFI